MIHLNLKTILFPIVLLFTVQIANSQDFVYDWVRSAGGERWDLASDLVIDQDKNVYMTGGFEQTAYFGSDSLVSVGERDVFIAKYDSIGTLQWLRQAGGKFYDNVSDIELDSVGNLLLAGTFRDTAYFDDQSIICSDYMNIFITKYSPQGNCMQLKAIQAETGAKNVFITLAEGTNFFLSGSFNNYLKIDDDSLAAQGKSDMFTATFASDFTKQNLFKFGGYGDDNLKDIKYFNNELYISCEFTDSINLNGTQLWSYGHADALLLKRDITGNLIQSKNLSGFGDNHAGSILITADSSIFLSGEFSNKIYIENDSLISNGGQDLYLMKLNPDFQTLWIRQIGNTNNEYVKTLLINTVDAIYLTGSFTDSLSIENKSIVSEEQTADMFIAKYTTEGVNIGLKKAGGSGYEYDNVLINDPDNYLYIIGNFAYDFAFETDSISSDSVFNANNDDVFIARFYDCDYARYPDIGNDTSFCGYGTLQVKNPQSIDGSIFGRYKKYVWNTGQRGKAITVYDSSYYSVTTIDNHKCLVTSDSIFVVVYPVPEPNLGDDITAVSGNLIELFGGYFASYLWSNDSTGERIFINPDTLSMPINIFSVTVENDYNCTGEDEINILVEESCFSPPPGGTQNYENENYNENTSNFNSNNASSTESVRPLGAVRRIADTDKEIIRLSALVYPNPNNGRFFININNIKEKIISLRIYSEEGRKVYEQNNLSSDKFDVNIQSKGAHYLIIETLNHLFFEKIIIQ